MNVPAADCIQAQHTVYSGQPNLDGPSYTNKPVWIIRLTNRFRFWFRARFKLRFRLNCQLCRIFVSQSLTVGCHTNVYSRVLPGVSVGTQSVKSQREATTWISVTSELKYVWILLCFRERTLRFSVNCKGPLGIM